MARRRPEFGTGGAVAEGQGAPENASFLGFGRCSGNLTSCPMQAVPNSVAVRRSQNRFLNHERYILLNKNPIVVLSAAHMVHLEQPKGVAEIIQTKVKLWQK